MQRDKDKYLCKTYPEIFADRNAPMTSTAMCWGFECGDGWFDLVDTLCANIQHHVNSARDRHQMMAEKRKAYEAARGGDWELFDKFYKLFPKDSPFILEERSKAADGYLPDVPEAVPQVVATQIKEKFGGLCFYYYGGDDEVHGMVRMAESLSYKICEDCGKPGKPNTDGWISTQCEDCRSKLCTP